MKKIMFGLVASLFSLISLTACASKYQVIDINAPIDPERIQALEQKYNLPPDPGQAGKETIAGIDADNDGVRDDVQRKIYFWLADNKFSKEYPRLIPMLLDYARNYEQFLTRTEPKEIYEYQEKASYIHGCILSYSDFSDSRYAYSLYGDKKYIDDHKITDDRAIILHRIYKIVQGEYINTVDRFYHSKQQWEVYRIEYNKTLSYSSDCSEINYTW